MTAFITVNFISRSSSLAPWIPLALLKICENWANFFPIAVAGLTVAVPWMVLSVLIDSWYYGVWTVPQVNFVVVNVVENLSIYFGVEPWHFYLDHLSAYSKAPLLGWIGLMLLTLH